MKQWKKRYDPLHKDVTFRLGGVEREMPLLEFGWRVVLYSEMESRDVATVSGLRNAETVNATHLTHMFWPTIGDGGYNVRKIKAKSIRNPRIKLAHRCITMTITGRKETTNHVTEIDLFYLYCIFREGVVCNIPYWLANVLNRKTPSHVYRKTSLIKMGVIMELHEGECCWPTTREVAREGGGNDEEGDEEGGNKGIGGSADIYCNMSQGDWQQNERAHWMYDHTVRQFQHMSTRDNLEPHLQMIHFLGSKPTTLLMATRDTCLSATHTTPTLLRMVPVDHSCFIPLLFSSLVIRTIMVIFDEKKLVNS
ncbi:retrotransposon ORF1 [Tanacetum coccineum]